MAERENINLEDFRIPVKTKEPASKAEAEREIRVATVLKGRYLAAFEYLLQKGGWEGVDDLKESKDGADFLRDLIYNLAIATGFKP